MRRSLAEWLLVPLILLPFAAAAGGALVVRGAYVAEVETIRRDGEAAARARLRRAPGGAAAWIRALRLAIPVDPEPGEILLRRADGGAVLRIRGETAAGAADVVWRVGGGRPVGLLPAALADPATRLRLETSARVSDLETVDPGTRELAELLRRPDLERLRDGPLPLATKVFVLRRWIDGGREELRPIVRLLRAGLRAMRGREARAGPFAPGVHPLGSATLLADGRRLVVVPSPEPAVDPPVLVSPGDEDDPFRVECVLGPAPPPSGEVLWSGRIETPVAGTWRVVAEHGDAWWRTATVRRWAGPVAGGLVAYLLVPTALFVSIRRRRRLDEARRRFLTELAHDLRTPLTSVRLYAEMLESGRVAESEREEYVSVLARESARLTSLLANLLDLSRLDRGVRTFEPASVDVAEVARDAVRDFLALEPDRAGDVEVEGRDGCLARADREALARAFANLLENAGKFTAPGTAVAVRWHEEGETLAIEVADEGPGIPAAERARVFERYGRGRHAARDGIPGTGLGLSLVRELVEGCGGGVRLLESPRGARFEIRLEKA